MTKYCTIECAPKITPLNMLAQVKTSLQEKFNLEVTTRHDFNNNYLEIIVGPFCFDFMVKTVDGMPAIQAYEFAREAFDHCHSDVHPYRNALCWKAAGGSPSAYCYLYEFIKNTMAQIHGTPIESPERGSYEAFTCSASQPFSEWFNSRLQVPRPVITLFKKKVPSLSEIVECEKSFFPAMFSKPEAQVIYLHQDMRKAA